MNKSIKNNLLFIFIITLILIQIFYFFIYFFTSGVFIQYGYSLNDITIGIILTSILLLHLMILVSIVLIFYGYQNKSKWMRKYTLFYLLWGILWGLWGILIGNNILLHSLLIIFYILGFYYFNTENVKKFFIGFCKYGKYVLYTKNIELKSGKKLPIFFFSINQPKSGIPSSMPNGYIIKENPNSHMPYLKKINNGKKNIKENTNIKNKKLGVVYIINHLQPGSNKGNWAIKYNKKILSSHRTKKAALKKAKIFAKKRNARVLVQNMNGKFSYGFNPFN